MLEHDVSPIDVAQPPIASQGDGLAAAGSPAPAATPAMNLADALEAIPDEVFANDAGMAHARLGDLAHPLALDVLETADRFEIHASVPGVEPEELDIAVVGASVRIAGPGTRRAMPVDVAAGRWLVRERSNGAFDRTVDLPAAIVPDAAAATVEDGVLIVRVPKVRPTGRTRIPIRALPDADIRSAESGLTLDA